MEEKAINRRFSSAIIYGASALILLFVYLFINTTADDFSLRNVQYVCIALIYSLAVFAAAAFYYKKISIRHVLLIILLIGLILRIYYVLCTPYNVRQHDFYELGDKGHYEYIYKIFTDWQLPDNFGNQFYHPPLHHFLAACMLKISQIIGFGLERSYEGLQLLTAFYSFVIMVVACKIFYEIGLKGRALLLAAGIMAVHPTFLILGGSLNNDVLSIMFIVIALLYCIKWYKNPNFKNIIPIALSIGLGMMTKLSVGTIALIVGPVFLIKWLSQPKFYKQGRFYAQFAVFAVICFPLALWHPIYNYIRLEQPIGYVPLVGLPNLTESHSLLERFFFIDFKELTSNTYCLPWENYNLPAYTIKCSMFGEFSFSDEFNFQAGLLLLFNIIVIIASLAAMIYVLIKDKDKNRRFFNWMMFAMWVIQILSFVYFNIKYPFGCTMDFRYIVPTLLSGAYFLARGLQLCNGGRVKQFIRNFVLSSTMLFIITSVWFYTLIY